MPCIVALFALLSPRIALFVMLIVGAPIARSMDSWLLPIIGFFVLPWTTFAWVLMWWLSEGAGVTGFSFFVVILAFLVDLGSYFGGFSARSARRAA